LICCPNVLLSQSACMGAMPLHISLQHVLQCNALHFGCVENRLQHKQKKGPASSVTICVTSLLFCRVVQHHINTPHTTVYLVISLPKIPYGRTLYIYLYIQSHIYYNIYNFGQPYTFALGNPSPGLHCAFYCL